MYKTGTGKIKQRLAQSIHHNIQKLAIKSCYKAVVFSNNMVKQVNSIVSRELELPIVKPGVDANHFYPIKDKIAIREKFHIPKDATVVLTVGRFVQAKGFDMVIKAISKLPQCHLVMVGDGESFEQSKSLVKDLGITNQVTMVGSQSDTSSFYQFG